MPETAPQTTATVTPAAPDTARTLPLLLLAALASMAAQRICDAMLPELSREFGVGLAEAAQTVSVFALAYGLAQLGYGPLGDRFGKLRVLVGAALLCAAGSLAAVWAGGLDALLVTRLVVGLGAAGLIPLGLAWVGDHVPYQQRAVALARIGLGITLGILVGQVAGGLFTDGPGWRWGFGAMALLFAGVGLWLAAEVRRQRRAGVVVVAATAPAGGLWRLWGEIVTGRWSRVVLAVALVNGFIGFGVPAIWAAHLHQVQGLSLSAAGAVAACYGLGGSAYMLLAGPLSARLDETRLAWTGGALVAGGYALLGLLPGTLVSPLAAALAGFGFFMFHNTLQLNATQMTPHARGTAVSLFACALFVGNAAGAASAAALAPWLGSGVVLAGAGAVFGALGAFFGWAVRALR
ncbi:MFS transporter [Hydrogenophaga sp. R2]|uniref:MFS transporter n=1 Tax=Hydrogenophaga sp. R2 TaxID=3132827 RepID=UPI003CE80610